MMIYRALAETLVRHGVNTLFGLMGNANLLYLPAFGEAGGRFVRVAHEAGAVAMADGYSRMSSALGVASVTHGPAFTNTLTPLVEAVRSRSRVLLITGDPPPVPGHFHHFDIQAATAVAGAAYEQVYEPSSLVRDLNRAIQRVFAERRPVVLNIPIAFMQTEASTQAPVILPVESSAAPAPQPDALDRALGLLASAQRPLILAGHGAITARDELVALAERTGAALATTALSKELFAGHPRDLGIFGSLAHGVAGGLIAEADCVAAFGASLNMWTTLNGDLVKDKKIAQIDTDPGRFSAYTAVDEAVVGDARLTAAAMNDLLARAGRTRPRNWAEKVEKALAGYTPQADFADLSGPDTVDIRSAMIKLDDVLPGQRTIISDIGRFIVGVWPYLRVADPRHFTTMGGFGSIGLGLAGTIGAALAAPRRPAVAALGDGGFMMHLPELTTAVRERLPIIVVVLNDGGYGAEHYKLKNHGYDPAYSSYAWPDLAEVATALGARALTVQRIQDLDMLPTLTADLDGPLLIDVRLDPDINLVRY